jgi:hypothetical protein
VARDLSGRPDVEYAQAAYRVHTMFVPNDALYKTLQWVEAPPQTKEDRRAHQRFCQTTAP